MLETPKQWQALSACTNAWFVCFRDEHAMAEEMLQACLAEARQLQVQQQIRAPIALAIETLRERVQAFFDQLAAGVRWLVPPPEWLLVQELAETYSDLEQPDLTEIARATVSEKHSTSVAAILSWMDILTDAPDLQVEVARLLTSLVDCQQNRG